MLTMAVNAIVTRATARLPDGGDTVAVAAPTHMVTVPKTRCYPGTSTHCDGVQWSCPELGVVAPAGLRAALGQKESGHSLSLIDGALPLPQPSSQPPAPYLLPRAPRTGWLQPTDAASLLEEMEANTAGSGGWTG